MSRWCVNSKVVKKALRFVVIWVCFCVASSFLFSSVREETTARAERTSEGPTERQPLSLTIYRSVCVSVCVCLSSLVVVSSGLIVSRGVLMPAEDEPSHRGDGARAADGFGEGGSP